MKEQTTYTATQIMEMYPKSFEEKGSFTNLYCEYLDDKNVDMGYKKKWVSLEMQSFDRTITYTIKKTKNRVWIYGYDICFHETIRYLLEGYRPY